MDRRVFKLAHAKVTTNVSAKRKIGPDLFILFVIENAEGVVEFGETDPAVLVGVDLLEEVLNDLVGQGELELAADGAVEFLELGEVEVGILVLVEVVEGHLDSLLVVLLVQLGGGGHWFIIFGI
jgi:hypothetical protein